MHGNQTADIAIGCFHAFAFENRLKRKNRRLAPTVKRLKISNSSCFSGHHVMVHASIAAALAAYASVVAAPPSAFFSDRSTLLTGGPLGPLLPGPPGRVFMFSSWR